MANDIIKEILLKFRVDGKAVEADVKKVEKTVQSLQRTMSGSGSGAGGGITNLNKTLEKFASTSQKLGVSMSKDMSKFQKTIQDVAQKDMRALQQQTDNLFKRTEDRLRRLRTEEKKLQDLQAGGADTGTIQNQQRRVNRYGRVYSANEQAFVSSAEQFNEAGQNLPGRGAKLSRFAGYAGAGVDALRQLNAGIMSAREQRSSATATLSGTLQQRKIASFRGDITEALMEGQDGSLTKARDFAQKQADAQGRNVLLSLGSRTMAGIGLGAAGGSLFAGVGAIPGAIIGGLGGFGSGVGAAYNYHFAGGKQQFQEQQRLQEMDREKQRNMTAYYSQFLQGRAPGRFEFQNQTRMGDGQSLAFRLSGYQNRFTEEQSTGTMLALRSTFGNQRGGQLAQQAMELSRSQGMDIGTATGLVQTAGISGSKDPKKTLTEVYTDAFSKGITDSGLLEVFQSGLAQIASRSPDVTDMASLSARMSASLSDATGGRTIGARDIMGAMGAQQALADISMQGGESGFTKMATLTDITGGNVPALAFLANRTDEEIFQLARNKDPRLVNMIGPDGVKRLEEEYNPAMTLSRKFTTTQMGREALSKATAELEAGRSFSEVAEGMGGMAEVLGGTGKISKETSAQIMAQVLQNQVSPELLQSAKQKDIDREEARIAELSGPQSAGQVPTSELQNLLARRAARQGGAAPGMDPTQAGALMDAKFQGMQAEDVGAAGLSVDSLRTATQGTFKGSLAPGAGIGGSVDNLVSALNAFADAVKAEGGGATAQSSGSN